MTETAAKKAEQVTVVVNGNGQTLPGEILSKGEHGHADIRVTLDPTIRVHHGAGLTSDGPEHALLVDARRGKTLGAWQPA